MSLTVSNYRTHLAQLDPDTLEDNRVQLGAAISDGEREQLEVLWPEVVEVLANNDCECLIEIADVVGDDARVAFRIFAIPWGSALVFAADSPNPVGTVVQHDPGEFEDPELATRLHTALAQSTVRFESTIRFA